MRSNRTVRVARAVATFSAAALLIAACGSDEDSGAADTTAAAAETTAAAAETTAAAADTTAAAADDTTAPAGADTTAPAATADKSPVLIVGTFDISSASSAAPSTVKVVEAWADYINEKGGINGHPVELDIQDVAGDAAKAQTVTQDLLAKDPILFLLNTPTTESSQAEALAAAEVPVMGVGYNPAIWGGRIEAFKLTCSNDPASPVSCGIPNAFAVTTTVGAVVDEQLYGAKAAGATTATAAACAEVDSCSSSAPIFSTIAASLGLNSVDVVKVSSTAGDYSDVCIGFIQQNVDFIQLSGGNSLALGVINSCRDQGYEGIFGASAGSVRGDLLKIDDIKLAGGLNAFPWWVDDPAVQEFRDVMEAAGIDEEGIADPTATGLWSVLQLFAKAQANLSDAPTGAEAIENMYTIQNETLDGLVTPISFSPDVIDRSRNCFWPYLLDNGELTASLGGLAYQCSPAES